jgi:murein DD-endopeptidase MepM/ murein hydrolase activator NlpD
MAKRFHKYRFNERTLEMEEAPFNARDYVVWGLRQLVVLGAVGFVSVWIAENLFTSPTDIARERELTYLREEVDRLNGEVEEMDAVLTGITQRDDGIYRAIFGAEPYPEHLRNPGVGGTDRNRNLRGYENSDAVIALQERVSELQRKLVAQTRSFEEILGLARNSSKLAESIPAIQPVRNRDLRALASGWGYRIHPIYKVRKFHYGMDFSAKTGTEVFATGDGVVVAAEQKYDGYGLHVVIRHGYGYQTLYAHMSKLAVRSGQRVKRGEVIGFVGSTGTSVAPHLHYEVIKDGEKVNPAHYYFNDLTPAQYEQILKMSDAANQSFD